MSDLIELKSKLVKAWRDLKNEKLPKELRGMGYAEVVSLSEEVSKLDPKFSMNIEMLEKYKEFKSAKVVARVVWPELDTLTGISDAQFGELEKHLEQLTALAVHITKKRLPREPQDSQLFGMIVSATTDKLIELEKHL